MQWFFFKKNDPSKVTASPFSDSKFSIDKWTSFTREIIQNSLDAVNDSNKPVIVKFITEAIQKYDVPGIKDLEEVISRCFNYTESRYTKERYEIALNLLNNNKLMFLKVSDFNTKGVCQAIKTKEGKIKDAWDALVVNEGDSVKENRDSGGSHGVGKRAPFIMSPIHTVYYSTFNNEGNQLFQGKTLLTDWVDDEDSRRSGKGWLGNTKSTNGEMKPLPVKNDLGKIYPFFVRDKTQGMGTDVIMALLQTDYEEIIKMKELIINSALENFFVAILQGKLELDILGEKISKSTYYDIMQKYYDNRIRGRYTGYENIKFGNLYNYTKTFLEPIKKASFPIKNMGSVILYFRPDNDRNRKHYSIVRTQGMKIKDVWINTDKPYTAIAYIEGGALNEYLLDLENAAHDDFVAPDNLSKAEREERLKILNLIYGKIEHYIRKETKIEAADIQDLEGLNEMIEFAGTMTTSKQAKPKVKGFINELNYKDQVGDPDEKGGNKGGPSGKKVNPSPNPNPRTGGKIQYGDGDKRTGIRTDSFIIPPYFLYKGKEHTYVLTMEPKYSFNNVNIKISAINSDEKKNPITELIEDIFDKNGNFYSFDNKGVITGIKLECEKQHQLFIKLKDDFKYQLSVEMEGIKVE